MKNNRFTAIALAAVLVASGGGFTAIGTAGALPAYASNEEPKAIVPTIKTTLDTISLSWSANPDENVVNYYTEIYGPNGESLENWFDREPTATFRDLKPNTTYTVTQYTLTRVHGGSSNYRSPMTTFTVTTKDGVLPPPPPPYVPDPAMAPDPVNFFNVQTVSYNQAVLRWFQPDNLRGRINNYTLTIKQTGKADRVFTVPDYFEQNEYKITGLVENTTYTAHVKAHVVAWEEGGKPATSPVASLTLKTPYNPSRVLAKAPTNLKTSRLSNDSIYHYWNQFDISWNAPKGIIGKVKNYTVTVKQGSKIARTFTTTNMKETSRLVSPKTTYTVSVKANVVSANGKKSAAASTGKVSYTTPAEPSGKVTLATPKVSFSKVGSNRFTTHYSAPTTGKITVVNFFWYDGNKLVASLAGDGRKTPGSLISGLKPSKKYRAVVQVTARSPNSKNSVRKTGTAYVTTASASAVKASMPHSLKASTTATSVSASWDATKDFIGKEPTFTVILKQGTRILKTVTTPEVSHKFTGLKIKTGYTILVKSNGVSLDGKKKTSTSNISLATKTK